MLTPLKFSCVLPVLVSVRLWGGLVVPTGRSPNGRVAGDRETTVPLPLTATASGLAGSVLLTPNPACLWFFAVGVKVNDAVQLATGAKVAPQLLGWSKSAGFKLPREILLL